MAGCELTCHPHRAAWGRHVSQTPATARWQDLAGCEVTCHRHRDFTPTCSSGPRWYMYIYIRLGADAGRRLRGDDGVLASSGHPRRGRSPSSLQAIAVPHPIIWIVLSHPKPVERLCHLLWALIVGESNQRLKIVLHWWRWDYSPVWHTDKPGPAPPGIKITCHVQKPYNSELHAITCGRSHTKSGRPRTK